VYDNIQEVIKYRNLELVSGDVTKVLSGTGDDAFVNSVQYSGYIMLEAKDGEAKDRRHPKSMHSGTRSFGTKTIFLLLDQNSTHMNSASNFASLLNRVPGIKESRRDYNLDIIVIPYQNPGSNILNKMAEYTFIGAENNGYVRLQLYRYAWFTSNKMEHVSVTPARIISRTEEQKLCNDIHANKTSMKNIRVSDPVAFWLGAEIGDVILQESPSEATIIEPIYMNVRA
jgi:DNA-directed RNA polymerase subunit H (RpoH/RPB5)